MVRHHISFLLVLTMRDHTVESLTVENLIRVFFGLFFVSNFLKEEV